MVVSAAAVLELALGYGSPSVTRATGALFFLVGAVVDAGASDGVEVPTCAVLVACAGADRTYSGSERAVV